MSRSARPIIANETKRKLRNGELALGFGVSHLRTGATALLAEASGHDWLFLDMEHGAFSIQEVTQICIAALPTGVTPLVRVCVGALDEGTRAVDGGAQGILMPHVDTVEQARRLADAFRFPPRGSRSWGEAQILYRYQLPGHAEAQAAINDEILIVAFIESMEGVANSAAIAAVEGIDVLLIGISDLTTEMGIAGQIAHPRVVDAIEKVSTACRSAGKVFGLGGVYDSENARRYLGMGARFVLTGYDHFYLLAGARARSEILRAAL